MRRGARWLALAVALTTLVACSEQSKVGADAAVRVHGVVQDAAGGPLGDRPVRLGSGVSDLEGGAAVLSVGMFCLAGICSGDDFDTTTAADGSYAFDLTGQDTQSSFGEAESFLLSASGPPTGAHPTGPAIGARFRIQVEDLALPSLQLVDPNPTLSASGPHAVLQWDAAAAAGPFDVQLADPEAGTLVWSLSTAKAPARIDGRILEDAVGRATVGGTSKDAVEGSELELSWVSPSVAFAGGYGAPPSRGAACEATAADGTTAPLDPCPLTDGSFESTSLVATKVRVTLPSAVASDLIVIRGCEATCRVWATPDGATAPVDAGVASNPFTALALDGSAVTAVEVEVPADAATLAEVSVWSPVKTGATPLRAVDDPADVGGAFGAAADGGRGWWPLLAGALIVLTALGLGIAIGRRRPLPS